MLFLMALTVSQHFESFMVRIDVNFHISDIPMTSSGNDPVDSEKPVRVPRLVLRGYTAGSSIGFK